MPTLPSADLAVLNDWLIAFAAADIDAIPFVAVERETRDHQGLARAGFRACRRRSAVSVLSYHWVRSLDDCDDVAFDFDAEFVNGHIRDPRCCRRHRP